MALNHIGMAEGEKTYTPYLDMNIHQVQSPLT